VRISKLLSYGLRHAPGELGLALDGAGWAEVASVLRSLAARGEQVTAADLAAIVRASDKQRFALSEDGTRIRANQGHSIPVDLGLVPSEPPERLYHGTVARFVGAIRASGLQRGARQRVHLSIDTPTAQAVGARRGTPVVLVVRAREMHAAGHVFHRADNGVWLTERVPAEYLEFPPHG
jgi:putative RNA 2'-phosphotransferase